MRYDVAILGGGPGGYVSAIRAAQLGLKVLLVEKENLGGVCLNKGCIPTKTLLKCSGMFMNMKESEKFGISVENIGFDFEKMMARKEVVVKTLVKGVESLIRANGIELVKGEGSIIDPGTVRVDKSDYTTGNIIIATGSKPAVPNIKGVNDDCVLDSDELLSMKSLPPSITIIGGGVIGIEFSVLLSELGCKVNIVEMFEEILINLDHDIVKLIGSILERYKINVITSAKVLEIDSGKVTFEKNGTLGTLQSDKVLLAVGRSPNINKNELDRLRIKHDNGRIDTNERMETNVKGIYAIGDVTGKYMLAHAASKEGIVAAENISGLYSKMNYKAIPQCIYIHPEVACVGMTEKEARENRCEISTGMFPLHANGKSVAEGDYNGFIKIVSEKSTGEILGVHMVCPHAADMISECVLAMNVEATAKDVADAVHPHPTVSEAVMEAAHAAFGRAIHVI